jgi:tetratricopeptide (TPR) repeat protein
VADEKAAAAEAARQKKLIEKIQKRLSDIGFDAGPVDGVAGQRTRDAASRFAALTKGDASNVELDEVLVSALDEAVLALRGAEKHLSKAQECLEQGMLEEASETLENAVGAAPWSDAVSRRKDEIATQIAEAKRALGTPADLSSPQGRLPSSQSTAEVDPSFGAAVVEAVNRVFSNAPGHSSASIRRALVIDPVVDGVSGAESVATRSMKSQIIELVGANFRRFDIKDFSASEAAKAPYVLIGTFTGVNKQRKTAGVREAFRICLTLLDVEWGTVASKTKVFSQAKGVDITPAAFYRDSPIWKADESTQAYIKSCQSTKLGDPVDPLYLARINAAALINEAIDAYENGSYKESQELFKRASQTDGGNQLRTYNGLYLTSWKLGELDQAMEAFANTVEYGLSSGRLGLKLPFMQGSTGLQVDPNDGGQQDMWLAQIAKEAARREYCLEILGHTHRAGPERLNQRLSLRRAEYVKRRLEAEVPELRDRIIGPKPTFVS